MIQEINIVINTDKKRYDGYLIVNNIKIYDKYKTLLVELTIDDITKVFGDLDIVLSVKDGYGKFYDLISKKDVTEEFWKIIEKIVIGINKIKMKG